MKKISAILAIAMLVVVMSVSTCFAAESLKVVDTYPKDGAKNTTIENMCFKLTFNNEMGDKAMQQANQDKFVIADADGKKIPIRVFYDDNDSKKVLVLADAVAIGKDRSLAIKDNTEYTLTISGELADAAGNTLGADKKVTISTINQKFNTMVYMVMMVVMFGGMFVFSTRQMKKKAEKENEEVVKEEAFNPYKEAKKTGKSVQEVIAEHEKEVAKREAKEAKKAAKRAALEEEYEEEEINTNYKVKTRRSAAAVGSKTVERKRAEREARLAEEERLAKRRAANAKKKKKK